MKNKAAIVIAVATAGLLPYFQIMNRRAAKGEVAAGHAMTLLAIQKQSAGDDPTELQRLLDSSLHDTLAELARYRTPFNRHRILKAASVVLDGLAAAGRPLDIDRDIRKVNRKVVRQLVDDVLGMRQNAERRLELERSMPKLPKD